MNNVLEQSKKVTKNVVLNYIKEIEPKYNSKTEFISGMIDELEFFGNDVNPKNRRSVRILLGVMKRLLFEKFGNEPMFVTNIKAVYPTNYPIKLTQSVNKFNQYELVIDNTDKRKPIAVILDIFDEGNSKPIQEVRVDTNGVMSDEHLSKLTLDKFISKFDHTNSVYIRLLRGLLLGEQEFVACGCKNGYMVGVSKPTTYKNALCFKDSIMVGEIFQIIPKSIYETYPKKL